MGNGGIENFVMNYYRFIDKTKVQFDFLTSVEEKGYFDDEIISMEELTRKKESRLFLESNRSQMTFLILTKYGKTIRKL